MVSFFFFLKDKANLVLGVSQDTTLKMEQNLLGFGKIEPLGNRRLYVPKDKPKSKARVPPNPIVDQMSIVTQNLMEIMQPKQSSYKMWLILRRKYINLLTILNLH